MKIPNRFAAPDGWILLCTWASLAGITLSALGLLSAVGFSAALLGGLAGAFYLIVRLNPSANWKFSSKRLRWRAKHPLVLLYFLYALLTLLTGFLYPPSNYDALSYRLPRVLHWLAEHRWHWISTANPRLNVTATGFEWLSAPVLALGSSDRFLFLINSVSYLLLPGLVFGVFARLGIPKRAAWYWMWLFPTGYCFVLQAGSIGNDLFGTVFCLAAIYYALRARESRCILDVWLSILSAALLTGAKATNLPLLLPIGLALLPSLKLLRNRVIWTLAVTTVAVAISFIPSALENVRNTGDWSGDPQNKVQVKLNNPLYGVLGNGLQLLVGNSLPPVMPLSNKLNAAAEHAMQAGILATVTARFPRLTLVRINEFAQEETAGIGLGLSGLLLVMLIAGVRWQRFTLFRGPGGFSMGAMIALSTWGALLAYMASMGSEAAVRLVTPYYPLLFASCLLIPGVAELANRRWWRVAAVLAGLSVLPPLVLSPARPLWPAQTVCRSLKARFPGRAFLDRAAMVYDVYRERGDSLAPLRKYIPADCWEVGFIGSGDDPETSLWRPFGKRKVMEIFPDRGGQLIAPRVSVVVVNVQALESRFGYSLPDWLTRNQLEVLGRERLLLQVQGGWRDWLVVQRPGTRK